MMLTRIEISWKKAFQCHAIQGAGSPGADSDVGHKARGPGAREIDELVSAASRPHECCAGITRDCVISSKQGFRIFPAKAAGTQTGSSPFTKQDTLAHSGQRVAEGCTSRPRAYHYDVPGPRDELLDRLYFGSPYCKIGSLNTSARPLQPSDLIRRAGIPPQTSPVPMRVPLGTIAPTATMALSPMTTSLITTA